MQKVSKVHTKNNITFLEIIAEIQYCKNIFGGNFKLSMNTLKPVFYSNHIVQWIIIISIYLN